MKAFVALWSVVLAIGACGHGEGAFGDDGPALDGGADGPASDPFAAECSADAGTECGTILAGWDVYLAGFLTTCEAVGGSSATVVVSSKTHPDREAQFVENCDGVLASPPLPRDRYDIEVTVLDEHHEVIGTGNTEAVIDFENDQIFANVDIAAHPSVRPGWTFGACSASVPCAQPGLMCVATAAGPSFCAQKCQTDSRCEDLYDAFEAPADAHSFCEYTDGGASPTVCYPHCSLGLACPTGMSCHGDLCTPD